MAESRKNLLPDLDRQGKVARVRSRLRLSAHRSPAEPPKGASSVPALFRFTIPEIINCAAEENRIGNRDRVCPEHFRGA